MIKRRKLGNTNLSVSEIGLGCWQLGGLTTINDISITYGNVNEKTAQKIISSVCVRVCVYVYVVCCGMWCSSIY